MLGLSVFVESFMQCTSKPTDLLHSCHPIFIVIFKVSSLVLLLICVLSYHFSLSQYIAQTLSLSFLIFVFSKYTHNGYRTYLNSISKVCLLVVVTVYLSVCVGMFTAISSFDFAFTLVVMLTILFFMVQNKSQFVFDPINFGLYDI